MDFYQGGRGLSMTGGDDFTDIDNDIVEINDTVVFKAGAQDITGVKTFTVVPQCSIDPSNPDDLSNRNYVDTKVSLTGTQTITGAKTFQNDTFLVESAAGVDKILVGLTQTDITNTGLQINGSGVGGGYLGLFARNTYFDAIDQHHLRIGDPAVSVANKLLVNSTDTTIENTNITITGATTFTNLPECATVPTTANQLTNKTYVDTKVSLTGNETVAGIKTFTSVPQCAVAPNSANALANRAYVDNHLSGSFVDLTTNQTIAGNKTFTGQTTLSTAAGQNLLTTTTGSNRLLAGTAELLQTPTTTTIANTTIQISAGSGSNSISSANANNILAVASNTMETTGIGGTNLIETMNTGGGNTIKTASANLISATGAGTNSIRTATGQNLIENTGAGSNLIRTVGAGTNTIRSATGQNLVENTGGSNLLEALTTGTNTIRTAGGSNVITATAGGSCVITATAGGSCVMEVSGGYGACLLTAVSGIDPYIGLYGKYIYYDSLNAHYIRVGSAPGTTKIAVENTTTTLINNSINLEGAVFVRNNGAPALNLLGNNTDGTFVALFPDGNIANRRAYFGYPGLNNKDFVVANEYTSNGKIINQINGIQKLILTETQNTLTNVASTVSTTTGANTINSTSGTIVVETNNTNSNGILIRNTNTGAGGIRIDNKGTTGGIVLASESFTTIKGIFNVAPGFGANRFVLANGTTTFDQTGAFTSEHSTHTFTIGSTTKMVINSTNINIFNNVVDIHATIYHYVPAGQGASINMLGTGASGLGLYTNYYPEGIGFSGDRKAYVGFPAALSQNFEIANQYGASGDISLTSQRYLNISASAIIKNGFNYPNIQVQWQSYTLIDSLNTWFEMSNCAAGPNISMGETTFIKFPFQVRLDYVLISFTANNYANFSNRALNFRFQTIAGGIYSAGGTGAILGNADRAQYVTTNLTLPANTEFKPQFQYTGTPSGGTITGKPFSANFNFTLFN